VNPGIIDRTGQVASDAISALKQNPVMLALVLLQFFILGAVLYSSIDRQSAVSAQLKDMHALLDKCVAGHIEN
jgi:hypothetical protein